MNQAVKQLFTVAFALVFLAGTAFAQNTTDIDQTGSQGNSTANVTQINGTDNSATVNQNSGFLNGAVTTLSGRIGHVTEILQDGSDNIGDVVQTQNQAGTFIDQVGDENETRISQAGFSTANVMQTGNRNIVGDFSNPSGAASSEQNSTSFPSSANELDVTQIGDDNTVGVDQRDNTDADIMITGDRNDVRVDQFEIFGDKDVADITVSGNDNVGYVTQAGGGNSFTLTQQNGDFNEARVDQSGGAIADILQDGSMNIVQGISGASSIGVSANGSTLDVDQLGTGNTLSLDQTDGANASVFQDGTLNTSEVIQN